jgi:hypothetical protein
MTTDAQHAMRNKQMITLVLGLSAAKALARNRVIVAIALAAMAVAAHRKGATASAALRRWTAVNVDAWRHG